MDTNPLRILLADDSLDDCVLFKEALKMIPLKTKALMVHDGQELMLLLEKQRVKFPHVIFLDLNMPRMSGYECLEAIKQNKLLAHLPIVILSTSNSRRDIDSLYKKGAWHYICKPNDIDTLAEVIHSALKYVTSRGAAQPKMQDFVLEAL